MVMKTKDTVAKYAVGDMVLVCGDLFDQMERWQKFQGFGPYCDASPNPDTCYFASKITKVERDIVGMKFVYDATRESVNKKLLFRKAEDAEVTACKGPPMYVFRKDGEKHPFKGVFWLKGGDCDPETPKMYPSLDIEEGERAQWKPTSEDIERRLEQTPSSEEAPYAEEVVKSDSASLSEVRVSPVMQMLSELNEEIAIVAELLPSTEK